MRSTVAILALSMASAGSLAGCEAERVRSDRRAPQRPAESYDVRTSELFAGEVTVSAPAPDRFAGNVHALSEGERLYAWFNCAGCHGAIGGGSIGPPLRDAAWIYGSSPPQVHQSIYQGRPNGMPSYGGRIPEDSMWKIVAFVRSLGEQHGAPAEDRSHGKE